MNKESALCHNSRTISTVVYLLINLQWFKKKTQKISNLRERFPGVFEVREAAAFWTSTRDGANTFSQWLLRDEPEIFLKIIHAFTARKNVWNQGMHIGIFRVKISGSHIIPLLPPESSIKTVWSQTVAKTSVFVAWLRWVQAASGTMLDWECKSRRCDKGPRVNRLPRTCTALHPDTCSNRFVTWSSILSRQHSDFQG